jgi:hypothetical protein
MAQTDFPTAEMIDLTEAGVIEISCDDTGKLWVNVNGKCLLRIGRADVITLEGFVGETVFHKNFHHNPRSDNPGSAG